MHALGAVLLSHLVEVVEELVCIERRDRCYQSGQRLDAGIESLVGRKFVLCHATTPEALLVQTDVPVGELVYDEVLYQTASRRYIIIA